MAFHWGEQPQTCAVQFAEQGAFTPFAAPSSHSSAPAFTPSPQVVAHELGAPLQV